MTTGSGMWINVFIYSYPMAWYAVQKCSQCCCCTSVVKYKVLGIATTTSSIITVVCSTA